MEFLIDPVVAGALTFVGVVLLIAWRRRSKRDRDAVEGWEPIYGKVLGKRAIRGEGGYTYRLSVSLPDRRDRKVWVKQEIFESVQLGDEVRLAVHPRRPKQVVHPDLVGDTPAGSVVFMIGVVAAFTGIILVIIGLLVDV